MITTNAAVLDALADCLESGDTLPAALEKVAAAGGAAQDWALRMGRSVRTDVPVAAVLRESNLLDADELSLLSAEGPAALASSLHAVALRRSRRLARGRAMGWGLVGPFVFGALTVVLDPLPNLITGGAYLWPVLRGLCALVILALAVLAGIPALLGAPRARTGVLRICAAVPGVCHLAALYAEEELTTALAPFVDGGEVGTAGLTAAASLLAWSPLGDALRMAARSVRPMSMPLPMAGLDPLARQLSPATDLAIIGGVASKRLSERLAQRGEAISVFLTARTRLVVRIGAYALVVLFSITSLAGMVARGLPGMPTLPGGATSPEEKQLEDLLKQLEQ
ncbi:MAG: hypothetical protein ACLP1X_20650 [Polyangiaceae bacterium]|jgi:hypothetical protein